MPNHESPAPILRALSRLFLCLPTQLRLQLGAYVRALMRASCVAIVVGLALTGCGQKGDLRPTPTKPPVALAAMQPPQISLRS